MPYEPTPSELERIILDVKAQMVTLSATLMDRYLLKEVADARERARDIREAAQDEQIRDLKDEVTTARRGTRTATLGMVGALLGAILFAAFQAYTKGGAGS